MSEFREAFGRMQAGFRDTRLEIDEVVETDENGVIVTGRWTGTASGVRLENSFSSTPTLRNCRVVRYEPFRDKAEALEAAEAP